MQHQLSDSGAVAIVILANMASKIAVDILSATVLRHVIVTELAADLHPPPRSIATNSVVRYVKMVPPYHLSNAIS